ncbi:MAG: phosphomannomutase, partial [Bryobacteraceae bacterium]
NYRVGDIQAVIERVLAYYAPQDPIIDRTDGLSVEFADWRFNLRGSNTEPLLRLNVESRGDASLVSAKVQEIQGLLD